MGDLSLRRRPPGRRERRRKAARAAACPGASGGLPRRERRPAPARAAACPGASGGLPRRERRRAAAKGMKPRFDGVLTRWIPGFMAFAFCCLAEADVPQTTGRPLATGATASRGPAMSVDRYPRIGDPDGGGLNPRRPGRPDAATQELTRFTKATGRR